MSFHDKSWLLLLLVCAIICVLIPQNNLMVMANAKFKVLSVEKCDDSCDDIPWRFTLKNADEDGYKKIDVEIDLQDIPLNENVNYTLVIDKFDGDQYQEDYYNEKGQLCKALDKYATKGWEKVVNLVQPRPEGKCNAHGSVFTLNDYEIMKDDVQLPPVYGQVRGTLKLFLEEKCAFCGMIEIDISDE